MTLPDKCPPLIAENIGERDDYGRPITLEQVAANVVDSGWHYSWHWDRNRDYSWNPMTLKGWAQAMDNGRSLLASIEGHAKQIRDVLPLIEAEIARHEREAAEEAEGDDDE